jgi:ubiquitin carboxyl-terminal hydrolase 4/11/15
MPLDDLPTIKIITANSSDLLSDLTRKIMRIMKIKGEVRWWKFKDV